MQPVSSGRKPVSAETRVARKRKPSRLLANRGQVSICEALDRLLNTGAVVVGEAMVSVAEIDLIYLQLQLVLSSVETAHAPCGRDRSAAPGGVGESGGVTPGCTSGAPSGRSAPEGQRRLAGGVTPGSPAGEGVQPPEAASAAQRSGRDGLAQLVLTLVKLVHELLQRQALRRIEAGSLSEAQIEQLGVALMRQFQEIDRLRDEFGLEEEDLNLDLGPIGKLF